MSGEDAPDPATGLTPREKKVVQETWAVAKQNMKEVAFDLFFRFFSENPSYQSLFPSLKDVPLSELPGNKKVLAHGMNVAYALTSLVDNLDEPECLVEMLKRQGSNHSKRRVEYSMFVNLGSTIVGLLKDKLGPQLMDSFATEAWVKVYGVIISVIKQGLEGGKKP